MLTKKEILDLLMLLSAVESFLMSSNTICPEYFNEKIDKSVELLSNALLKGE